MKKALIILAILFLASVVHAGLWDSVANLPNDVANALIDSFKQIVIDFVTPLLDLAKTFITSNPNVSNYESYWQAIITLISAFYLLIFIFVGLKFVVGSYSEVQRMEAKEWAKKAILIVVLCNASLFVYSLILDIGSASALYLWNTSYESLFQLQNLSVLNLFLVIFFALAVLFALLTLCIRYLLVLVGIMAFPIGIFLYLIPPLQAYGKIILNTIAIVIFLQFFDVLVLVASSLLIGEFSNSVELQLLAPTFGFFLIGVMNILLLKFALLKAAADTGTKIVIPQIINQIIPAQNPQTNLMEY